MNLGDKGVGKWVPYMIHMKVMCVSSHGGLQFPLSPSGPLGFSVLKKL